MALSFVLYEAALRGPLADKEQLLQLLDAGSRDNVVIQVLTYERAIPAALMGPMVLLEPHDRERYALSEGQSVSQFTSDPEVVSKHTERLSMIRTVALSPAESVTLIERMAEDR